jgi:hypothetical protein
VPSEIEVLLILEVKNTNNEKKKTHRVIGFFVTTTVKYGAVSLTFFPFEE